MNLNLIFPAQEQTTRVFLEELSQKNGVNGLSCLKAVTFARLYLKATWFYNLACNEATHKIGAPEYVNKKASDDRKNRVSFWISTIQKLRKHLIGRSKEDLEAIVTVVKEVSSVIEASAILNKKPMKESCKTLEKQVTLIAG